MGTLGERLRREREAKGVSLAEIATQTRIGARLLKAIEEEEFDLLPGGIYNRAFVRQYASFLGLDEEEAVREYLQAAGTAQEAPAPPVDPSPETPASRAVSYLLRWNAASLALVPFAAAALWLMFRTAPSAEPVAPRATVASRRPAAQPVRRAAEPPRAPRPRPSPRASSEPVPAHVAAVASAPAEPVPDPAPAAQESAVPATEERPAFSDLGGDELLLEINARSDVWLYITADGEELWQGILRPNQTRQVQAAESIRLTVGNAGGVELMLNGKPLGELGREGEVKRVSIAGNSLPTLTP